MTKFLRINYEWADEIPLNADNRNRFKFNNQQTQNTHSRRQQMYNVVEIQSKERESVQHQQQATVQRKVQIENDAFFFKREHKSIVDFI